MEPTKIAEANIVDKHLFVFTYINAYNVEDQIAIVSSSSDSVKLIEYLINNYTPKIDGMFKFAIANTYLLNNSQRKDANISTETRKQFATDDKAKMFKMLTVEDGGEEAWLCTQMPMSDVMFV